MSLDVKIFTACDHYTGRKQYIADKCPKCQGKGYYYDIGYDKSGHAILTTGTLKLQQEMLKIINDEKGNNIFFPEWGCEVQGLVGTKITKLTQSKIQMMIRLSLEYLRALQIQENNDYQNMTNDEILLGVENLDVINYIIGFEVSVTIKNSSNEILDQTILL